jgi:ribosomal protein S14
MNTDRAEKAESASQPPQPTRQVLHCSVCGNNDRFVQITSREAHLVNRDGTYIRLLDSEIDHYLCYFCGERVGFIRE